MSSTPVLAFIKDIIARNVKAVADRLTKERQSPNQHFSDPKEQGLSYSLLHKAVGVGSSGIVGALLAAGEDVNAADSRGRTPLHWVAAACNTDAAAVVATAELLLAQPGIDIHARNSSKATPLHEAAAAGNVSVLQLLLQHGAEPQDATPGMTALHAACMGSTSIKPSAQPATVMTSSQPATATASAQPAVNAKEHASTNEEQQKQQQQQRQPAESTTSALAAPKPGQLKAAAAAAASSTTKTVQPMQLRPKPPTAAAPKKAGTGLHQRPTAAAAGSRAASAAAPARNAGSSFAAGTRTSTTCKPAAAPGAGAGAAAAGALKAPTAALPDAALPAVPNHQTPPAQGGAQNPASLQPVLQVLLQAMPGLLGIQDSGGFTLLMRLVQRCAGAEEVGVLLAAGDCNINAQAASTDDTALHLACSSPSPDLQLVAALVAAGADATLPRACDGHTPLLLAAKAGGQSGLALAKVLLQTRDSKATGQQQQGQAASSGVWCRLDGPSAGSPSGVDAANAAGKSAVGVVAAAVLAEVAPCSGPAAAPAAATLAAAAATGSSAAEQLLVFLLAQNASLSQQHAGALLQLGLTGHLSDSLTAKVVDSMPDEASLHAAAGAAGVQQPDFRALLAARMYRMAVALLSKASGKRPCDDLDADGNTLLHRAVSSPDGELPGYLAALVEAGVPVNAGNREHDAALHIAARQGNVQACRVLVEAGADLLRRNGKNRIPGSQLKLSEAVKSYLQQAEEEFRATKEEQRHALWDDQMRATQTQSAFGVRVT